jgi:hypothetical protein
MRRILAVAVLAVLLAFVGPAAAQGHAATGDGPVGTLGDVGPNGD